MNIYALVTNRIISELEKGSIPWQKPWSGSSGAISHLTGKPYSLLNQILLDGITGEYLTFEQARKEGGSVRKGEKGKKIVFWKFIERKNKNGHNNDAASDMVPLLRCYTVFHISQCENIEQHYGISERALSNSLRPDKKADKIIDDYAQRSGVTVNITFSGHACYSPTLDQITVPELKQYTHVGEYYSTLFHELTHSTGHPKRLNRLDSNAMFGSEKYSKEELIAELGSAYLVNHCGLETEATFRNSVGYLQGWLKALMNDKKLIILAAGKAEKAIQMILGNETKTDEIVATV